MNEKRYRFHIENKSGTLKSEGTCTQKEMLRKIVAYNYKSNKDKYAVFDFEGYTISVDRVSSGVKYTVFDKSGNEDCSITTFGK